MSARDRWMEAAVEGTWGCRLAYARIKTPVHPPAIDQFEPMGHPDDGWVYDWYSHVLFASQVFESVRALLPVITAEDLQDAFATFSRHWQKIAGVRTVLMHPTNTGVDVTSLRAFADRIEYRKQGHDPRWEFTVDELHQPIEELYTVVQRYRTA